MATYTTNYNLEKPDASDNFGDFRASYNSNMDIIDQNLSGGGGSGDTVSWTQIQATGEKIAEITINGTTTDVLIPFEAKIIVTTTTGLTVTATKGGTTYTATETSTGVYEVTVDSKGTWTVTDGTNTATVNVTAQTTYNVAFVVIPDGSTVTPTDDIQTWLNCANIWDKNYTTLAEVLADTTTLSALISSNNAVDYLVRSTTWIGNTATVPVMTDNTHPSGVASASSTHADANAPYKAFDGSTSTFHSWVANQTGNYLRYDFEHPVTIARYSFVLNRYQATSAGTKNLAIQVSDDGLTWTNIDTFTVAGGTTDFTRNQDISGINTFRYIQIYTNDIMRPTGNAWNMSTKEFQIYSLGLTNSSTAMSYIGLNNYCANKLLADATWLTAICNSTYFESVLNAKVPSMTSDSTPSGTCAASSTTSGYAAYRAFISSFTDTGWAPASGSSFGSSWVSYEFTTPIKVKKVKARYVRRSSAGYTLTFKIQGYNTSTNAWEDLTSGLTAYENTTVNNVISSNNSKNEHRKYRALLLSGSPAAYSVPDAGDGYHFQFYGREDV